MNDGSEINDSSDVHYVHTSLSNLHSHRTTLHWPTDQTRGIRHHDERPSIHINGTYMSLPSTNRLQSRFFSVSAPEDACLRYSSLGQYDYYWLITAATIIYAHNMFVCVCMSSLIFPRRIVIYWPRDFNLWSVNCACSWHMAPSAATFPWNLLTVWHSDL